jgi:hypothetical protein
MGGRTYGNSVPSIKLWSERTIMGREGRKKGHYTIEKVIYFSNFLLFNCSSLTDELYNKPRSILSEEKILVWWCCEASPWKIMQGGPCSSMFACKVEPCGKLRGSIRCSRFQPPYPQHACCHGLKTWWLNY